MAQQIDRYRFKDGWHEVRVSGLRSDGSAIYLSTKRCAVGQLAKRACEEHLPVIVTPDRSYQYLDSLEIAS